MSYCSCGRPSENKDTGDCASCGKAKRKALTDGIKEAKKIELKKTKKPIAKVSGKMADQLAEYSKEKAKWLPGKMCVVFTDMIATTIHHALGRVGYADDWARQHNISLLLDKRYWIPCSLEGHIKIEKNKNWAREKGFSCDRLAKR